LTKKADSLYKVRDYKNSAFTYSAAFKSFGWLGLIEDRYNAACSWALAGYADSAFYNLERVANKGLYYDPKRLSSDEDLKSLHTDQRWQPLIDQMTKNKEKAEAGLNMQLIRILDSMETEDQKWRNYSTLLDNGQVPKDSIPMKEVIHRMILADSLNYPLLKNIFSKYGFPNYDIVGQNGSQNFWLLVQHQDNHPAFQDSVLTKMKEEVDHGKASAVNYAYLIDRVKVNTGQQQIYGTQMQMNSDTTSFIPKPVINPDHLNERRKSVGMPSEENYIDVMNNRYFGSLKKK
jgi:hypothetical protein